MSGPLRLVSYAADWRALASDIALAIDQLKARADDRMILIGVADDLRALTVELYRPGALDSEPLDRKVHLAFPPWPAATDQAHERGETPPNASIDRAIAKVAAGMLSWTKDPETFELIEHCRYRLFLRWPGGERKQVDEYAYGLWDE
jgi:hypothetical protein